jgi:hypothetical protein
MEEEMKKKKELTRDRDRAIFELQTRKESEKIGYKFMILEKK